MRVLLINTNVRDDVFAAPPVGLCYVASAASAAGHQVHVLDLCFSRDPERALERYVTLTRPQVIGLSVRNIDNVNMLCPISYIPGIARLATKLRSFTDAVTVIGGSGASLAPEQALEALGADYVVVSDGERAFVRLLDAIDQEADPGRIPGVGMLREGRFHLRPPDLADFPPFRPNLGKWLDLSPYERIGASACVQTKRGCRRRCIYCTYGRVIEGVRFRLRSPGDVADEIEEAVLKHGVRSFEFVDSIFNDPPDYCREVLEEIARRPWKASFSGMGVSPKGLDRTLLDLMDKAGFTYFWLSPESACDRMLENYRKDFGVDEVVHAAEALRKTRFTVLWTFLLGGPGETNDTMAETIRFAERFLKPQPHGVRNMISYYLGLRVYPGTVLREVAEREGFLSPESSPLAPAFYVSRDLDLTFAVRALWETSFRTTNTFTGFDERYMFLSKAAAKAQQWLGLPKPYWAPFFLLNRLAGMTGINKLFKVEPVANKLAELLKNQKGLGLRG